MLETAQALRRRVQLDEAETQSRSRTEMSLTGVYQYQYRFRGRFPRRAGGAAGRAAAMGGRDGLDLDAAMVGDHRRPVAAARLGRREKEDCLFTAELCPHRQRASRAKPL